MNSLMIVHQSTCSGVFFCVREGCMLVRAERVLAPSHIHTAENMCGCGSNKDTTRHVVFFTTTRKKITVTVNKLIYIYFFFFLKCMFTVARCAMS